MNDLVRPNTPLTLVHAAAMYLGRVVVMFVLARDLPGRVQHAAGDQPSRW